MSQPWTTVFTFNRKFFLDQNLDGISQAMADRAPATGVNRFTWVLTHILSNRGWTR